MRRWVLLAAGALALAGCSSSATSAVPTSVKKSAPKTTATKTTATTTTVGSTTTTTTSATTTTTSAVTTTTDPPGPHYLAIVAPANAALDKFESQSQQWTSATTSAEMSSEAQPVIDAFVLIDTELQNGQWPASAEADIHTLIGDDGAIVGDLRALSTLSPQSVSSWETTVSRDAATDHTAVNLVRHDLGLPPEGS